MPEPNGPQSGASPVFDVAIRELLPGPIASRARDLAWRRDHHGSQATAWEVAALVEAVLDHIFRLWVAEFAHAGAPDAPMARSLVGRLSARLHLGQRVAVAREIRAVFGRISRTTVVEGLADLDFGPASDDQHPVARMVAFRNAFAHGSFRAGAGDIATHSALVEQTLGRLDALWRQPVMTLTESGTLVALCGAPQAVAELRVSPALPLQPFLESADGATRLDLYPLWRAGIHEDGQLALLPAEAAGRTHGVDQFWKREPLRQYAARWLAEREGFLDHRHALRERAWRSLSPSEDARLMQAVQQAPFTLVQAPPGTGKAAALVALLERADAGEDGFDDVASLVLAPGEPSQSAANFAHWVARAAERALGLAPRALSGEAVGTGRARAYGPAALARRAANALREGDRRVLLLLEDAHHATTPLLGERETVAGVVRELAQSPVHIVATTHPWATRAPLAHDRLVVMDVPESPLAHRVAEAVEGLAPLHSLHRRALSALAKIGAPSSLFAICDAMEQEGPPVFEPAVERALAELRPLLTSGRDGAEGGRHWALFHPVVGEVLDVEAGAR